MPMTLGMRRRLQNSPRYIDIILPNNSSLSQVQKKNRFHVSIESILHKSKGKLIIDGELALNTTHSST